jgi:hypothetical protein
MLIELNPMVEQHLVGGDIIKNWIEDDFQQAKISVCEVLQSSISKIHISFNLWTSSHRYTICGIVAHFVGLDYTAQNVLIGLKRIKTTHSRKNVAPVILSTAKPHHIRLAYMSAMSALSAF